MIVGYAPSQIPRSDLEIVKFLATTPMYFQGSFADFIIFKVTCIMTKMSFYD